MAGDITFTAALPLNTVAGVDLRAQAGKLVQAHAVGVKLAVVGSGQPFALWNLPNSGDFVSVLTAPNVAKLYCDSATAVGQYLTISAVTSGVVCPYGNVTSVFLLGTVVGVALTGVNSGSLCDVLLI